MTKNPDEFFHPGFFAVSQSMKFLNVDRENTGIRFCLNARRKLSFFKSPLNYNMKYKPF